MGYRQNPLGQNPLLTEAPQNILPDKIPLDINPSGQNLLETESPHKKIVSKNIFGQKPLRQIPLKTKSPIDNIPSDKIPSQYKNLTSDCLGYTVRLI